MRRHLTAPDSAEANDTGVVTHRSSTPVDGRVPDIRVLSLGAGVQSTTLLLLAAEGRLPRLDAASPHPTPVPGDVHAEQWVGISRDEVGRARDSDVRYAR